MSEIAEFERRISFALERIERGHDGALARARAEAAAVTAAPEPAAESAAEPTVSPEAAPEASVAPEGAPDAEAPPVPVIDPAELAALREALEGERQANAQLSERVRALREKQETTLSALERRLGAATRALDAAQAEAARLKRANADLAAANAALVAAGSEGAGALVNRVMQAELEALRAARAADADELADLLAGLDPILAAAEARATEAPADPTKPEAGDA
ncbi:MAG: hypothetical protein R3D78_03815 [Paracoccaceae bacterium]